MQKLFFILFVGCVLLSCKVQAEGMQVTFQDTTVIDEDMYDYEDTETQYLQEEYQQTKVDTTLYFNNLSIKPDSIAALKNNKSFAYIKDLDSLLKAEQDKEKPLKEHNKKRSNFFEKFFSSNIVKVLFWALGICFVLFLLYRLFLADGIFKRTSTKYKSVQEEPEEDTALIGNSDFNVLIDQALRTKDYRLAIRYNYLKSLQLLVNNGVLQIAPDKTNYQYVREINNYEYQNIFSSLTLHYEYVWYGEFVIDEVIYRKIEADFIKFNKNFR